MQSPATLTTYTLLCPVDITKAVTKVIVKFKKYGTQAVEPETRKLVPASQLVTLVKSCLISSVRLTSSGSLAPLGMGVFSVSCIDKESALKLQRVINGGNYSELEGAETSNTMQSSSMPSCPNFLIFQILRMVPDRNQNLIICRI